MSSSQSIFLTISCASLLKDTDHRRVIVIAPDQPIIVVGALYANFGVDAVVIQESGPLTARQAVRLVSGEDVLKSFVINPGSSWPYLMKAAGSDLARGLSYVQAENSLGEALEAMERQRYGTVVVVNRNGEFAGVLTVSMVMRFMQENTELRAVLRKIRLRDIVRPYPPITVSPEETLNYAINKMLNSQVRRLVVEGHWKILSDRSIIRFLMRNAAALESLRDQPYSLLEAPIASLGSHLERPAACSYQDSLDEVLENVLASEALCALVGGNEGIVTPWDLTVRLYRFISENKVPSPA
jgi:predicted transcriptional regulator